MSVFVCVCAFSTLIFASTTTPQSDKHTNHLSIVPLPHDRPSHPPESARQVRRKTLALAMELISSRNIEEMVLVLKKEVSKTHNVEHEDTGRYRQLLVRTLHSCCIRFPDVAATVIPVLAEFLTDTNEQAAAAVLVFIREAVQKNPLLRALIAERLIETFGAIQSARIHRAAMWILGEYAEGRSEIDQVVDAIHAALGEIPMVEAEQRRLAGDEAAVAATAGEAGAAAAAAAEGGAAGETAAKAASATKVTSDGTYATQSAFSLAP